MPPIYVCFLQNDAEIMERHWLNAMAARVAPSGSDHPKIHVELFFPAEHSNLEADVMNGEACSIHYSGQVFFLENDSVESNGVSARFLVLRNNMTRRTSFARNTVAKALITCLTFYNQPVTLPVLIF